MITYNLGDTLLIDDGVGWNGGTLYIYVGETTVDDGVGLVCVEPEKFNADVTYKLNHKDVTKFALYRLMKNITDDTKELDKI